MPSTDHIDRVPVVVAGAGADGAHSRARSLLGIAMEGPDHLHEQLTVLFGIGSTGAVLVRPGAQVIACWPVVPPDPRDSLLETGWFGEPVSPGGGRGRMRRGRRP